MTAVEAALWQFWLEYQAWRRAEGLDQVCRRLELGWCGWLEIGAVEKLD